ncbi:MAG: GDP-mannose 4,6-dehydratase [Armatimonadetes bacterium]|nr:GDP-mannose 4,6-dehydratase [Armatimonadota bacterium]
MRVLVTGGAGFIGRWVVSGLSDHEVWVLDNLSNGSLSNLAGLPVREFIDGDIRDNTLIRRLFSGHDRFDVCFHLAAQINVQHSIDFPKDTFESDVIGTHHLLEACRTRLPKPVRFVFVSTCMVYAPAGEGGLSETSPVLPASPYAGAKLAGEYLSLSYHHAYGLPVVVLRPFNTYGPYQKTSGEGGVVGIFVKKALKGEALSLFGDGHQTRDLLYAEDCADFIIRAAFSQRAVGEILNGGTGRDIAISDLAALIAGDSCRVAHVPHPHPQSEIRKLLCDSSKAREFLSWAPRFSIEEGITRTRQWISQGQESRV